jgi:threonine aldolase
VRGKDYWLPRTSLVCVENTHNRAGGRIFPQSDVVAIGRAAKDLGLAYHLDGARIWNASIATKTALKALAAPFDTASVCFSKGLGAPVGSALLGTRSTIRKARRLRKMWGGAMRQAGLLAAAAAYALTHHVTRLAEDHANAKLFAAGVRERAKIDVTEPETNIVMLDVEGPAERVAEAAKARGLLINAIGPHRLRAVLHLDVSKENAQKAAEIFADAVGDTKLEAKADQEAKATSTSTSTTTSTPTSTSTSTPTTDANEDAPKVTA